MAAKAPRPPRSSRTLGAGQPVQDTVQIGGTPGAPNIDQKPTPSETTILRADPREEYLAGVGINQTWFLNLARSLEPFIDDLTADVGDDVYLRMMADPQVAASVNVFKASVLETGPVLMAAIKDTKDKDYGQAQLLTSWCEAILGDLHRSIDDVLWNMTDAFFLGNKIAELVWDYTDQYTRLPPPTSEDGTPLPLTTVPEGPQLVLTDIKVKPRESVGFLVDAFMNILGILGHIPGNYYPIMPGMVYASIDHIPNLLPVEKFAILTFRPRDSDPRGVSILRPAYNAWYIKQQAWTEYTKFLSQMAGGMLIGKPDPSAIPLQIQNPDGSPTGETATPAETMLQVLLRARNGAVLVVEPGAEVDVSYPQGDGSAFLEGFSLLNQEIIKGILHVSLATNEGEHNARAASEVHADILSILIRQAKRAVARMVRSILQRMVQYNFGEQATRLVPHVTLGSSETANQGALMASVAQLMSAAYLAPDQLPQIDALLGLPVRVPTDQDDETDASTQDATPEGKQPVTAPATPTAKDRLHANPMAPQETPTPASPGSYTPTQQRRKAG